MVLSQYPYRDTHPSLFKKAVMIVCNSLFSHSFQERWIRFIQEHNLEDAFSNFFGLLRRQLIINPTANLLSDALQRLPGLHTIPTDAAARACQVGDVERAIEMLDEGRSLLYTNFRYLNESWLQSALACVDRDLANDFASVRSRFQSLHTVETTRRYEFFPSYAKEGNDEYDIIGTSLVIIFTYPRNRNF